MDRPGYRGQGLAGTGSTLIVRTTVLSVQGFIRVRTALPGGWDDRKIRFHPFVIGEGVSPITLEDCSLCSREVNLNQNQNQIHYSNDTVLPYTTVVLLKF